MQVLESKIERDFVRLLTTYSILSIKLRLTGERGWPDRLVLIPGGHPVFIEFKRPGQALRSLQLHRHKILRTLGYDVKIFDDAIKALKYVFQKVPGAI